MSKPTFAIEYTEPRSRLSVLFRAVLYIPHYIIEYAWRVLAQVLAFVQWFVILFTGRRNEGIWKLQRAYLGYAARVWAYYGLSFDKWPNIGAEPNGEPTRFEFEYTADANRLTNFFRFIWLVPTLIVAIGVMIVALICVVLSWFAIIITGKHPRGLFDFLARTHAFMAHVQACAFLMSDVRPKF
jgi:hypothetical protein